jgi:hypothetical protein
VRFYTAAMRAPLAALALVAIAMGAGAQAPHRLRNADVIALQRAGLAPAVILAKIQASPAAFDTSTAALTQLNADHVPQSVILAMIEKPVSPREPKLAATASAPANGKPLLVVAAFRADCPWPYPPAQLQQQTVAELQSKDQLRFNVLAATGPAAVPGAYELQGEILAWHAGNRAVRLMVGLGAGRETAKIRYWLLSPGGRRLFQRTDTIRAAYWNNAYAGSSGQLAQPFADKIAARLRKLKLKPKPRR